MKSIKRTWYVVNMQDRALDCDESGRGHQYNSEDAAIKRAVKLAEGDPHCGFDVVVRSHRVFAEVKSATIVSAGRARASTQP